MKDHSWQRYLVKTTITFAIAFSLIACTGATPDAATPTPEPTTFEGHYTTSFEVSSFVPCGLSEQPGYGKGYWLNATRESGFYKQYETITSGVVSETSLPPSVIVYVRFNGQISPADSPSIGYGHLGLYVREITVTEVIEMSLDGKCPG